MINFYRKKKTWQNLLHVDNVWGPGAVPPPPPSPPLPASAKKIKFTLECGFPQIHFVAATERLLLTKRKVKELCPFFSGSSTEVRWRTKHPLCRMDREEKTKEVEHSRIGGMRNWRIRHGLVLIVAVMLLMALILHS